MHDFGQFERHILGSVNIPGISGSVPTCVQLKAPLMLTFRETFPIQCDVIFQKKAPQCKYGGEEEGEGQDYNM